MKKKKPGLFIQKSSGERVELDAKPARTQLNSETPIKGSILTKAAEVALKVAMPSLAPSTELRLSRAGLLVNTIKINDKQGIFYVATNPGESQVHSAAVASSAILDTFMRMGLGVTILDPGVYYHPSALLKREALLKQVFFACFRAQEIDVLCGLVESSARLLRVADGTGEYAAIDVKGIPSELPFPTDAYIYFPLNSKYVRYIREGDKLTQERREHMKTFNSNQLFIRRDERTKFEGRCATWFFDQSIETR